jgi:hypothetical protein
MQAVYGYKIYTDTQRHDNTIGLYEGTLCWIMAPVALVAEPWKCGMLTPSSAMDSEDGLDTRTGGGRSEVGGFNIIADNTLQITARLAALGIVLTGKRCERIRFDPTNGREYIEYTGFCEEVTWNEREIVIPVQDCQLKRDANLTAQITSDQYPDADESILGNAIPVVYGIIDKARFVRTANKETIFANPARTQEKIVSGPNQPTNPNFAYYIVSVENYPYELDTFCCKGITSDSPSRNYRFALAGSESTTIIHWTLNGVLAPGPALYHLTDLIGQYVKVTSGKSSGEMRRIASAVVVIGNPLYSEKDIYIQVSDYFTDELAGNETGTADQNSWIQIVDIAREYEVDTQECKAFTDQDGADIATPTALQLFSYEQPKTVKIDTDQIGTEVQVANKQMTFYRLPEYAYTEAASALKNAITIDAKLFDGDPDKMDSFIILPPDSLTPIKDNTLGCFNADGDNWHKYKPTTTSSHLVGGYYYYPGDTLGTPAANRGMVSNGGGVLEVSDKDRSTYFYNKNSWPINPSFSILGAFVHAIRFTFPKLNGLFDWDDCFLLIDMSLEEMDPWFLLGEPNNEMRIRYRKYYGYAVDCFSGTDGMLYFKPDKQRFVKDSPDFYFDSIIDNNKAFYWNNPGQKTIPPFDQDDIYGHTKFIIPNINNDSDFNAIRDFAIVMKRYNETLTVESITNFYDELRIYELGMMFRKSVSIGDAIYSGIRGRIRGTTWRPGRIASDLLDNAIDIIEDALRRQNWSETGSGTTPGEQSSAARINVKSTHGGFESSSLDTVRSFSAARQILTYDESRISEVVKSLCQQYHLIQYRESNGTECVVYFPERDTEAPVRTITLADVPADEEIPDVEEPSSADVFCYDLTIRYNENYGSGKFDGTISITHTDADEYDPDYVQGYDGGYKQAVWERAHALYQKFKRQEKPPTELTNLTWHRTAEGAGWYLRGWLNWMGKSRLTLPVKYEVARKIPRYSRVTINLPHHTDGQDVICFVERIKMNPTTGRAALGLVLYDDVQTSGGGGTSVSYSSASDSVASVSSSSDSSSSMSGSKSLSSSSDSVSQSVSVSVSSSSESSQPEITDEHRHIAIWTQQNDHEGVKMKVDKQVGIYSSPIDFAANQKTAFGTEDNQYAAIKKIDNDGGAEIRGFTIKNHLEAIALRMIGYTENELDATHDAAILLRAIKHNGFGGHKVLNDNSRVLIVQNYNTDLLVLQGSGRLYLPKAVDAATDTDKFVVFDNGNGFFYRTGAEVLSDIGAAAVGAISGTANKIAKFASTSTVGDSSITDTGSLVTLSTIAKVVSSLTSGRTDLIIEPSAALVAGRTYYGINFKADNLNPATGDACSVTAYRCDFSSMASVDHNASVFGFSFIAPTADASYGYRWHLRELTENVAQHGIYCYSNEALSATATYRGLYYEFGAMTRDAGAPVIEGIRVTLPTDYTNFGTCYAGRFAGDGRIAVLCDTDYALKCTGESYFSSTIYAGSIGADTDNSVVILNSAGLLKTDEIDSRVWGATLVDNGGVNLTANYLPKATDADTVANSTITDTGTVVTFAGTTDATNKDTAAVVLEGGIGVEKKGYFGSEVYVEASKRVACGGGATGAAGAAVLTVTLEIDGVTRTLLATS